MNFIYIHTHDTGRYISPYGYDVPTPNLLAFAKEGTLFRKAYSTAPTCSASRSSMLCGMYPHSTGMLGLAHRGFSLTDPQRHLSSYLGRNGYHTVLCGIHHEGNNPKEFGYQDIITRNRFSPTDSIRFDTDNADAACTFLKAEHPTPFFLSFGMFSTHLPYPENDEFDENYIMPPYPIADTVQNRKHYGNFLKSVSTADNCIGTVIDTIKGQHLWDDSILLYTTDHGLALPNMKCTLYDTGIGVSLILAGGAIEKGACIEDLVSHIDLFPTICDLLHLPKPGWLQGKSLLPLLEKNQPIREYVFSEVTFHASYQPMRSVRTKKYKLIRLFYDPVKELFANIDASCAKDYLLESNLFHRKTEPVMLFDLECDPMERQNLAEEPKYREIRDNLRSVLQNHMEQTEDPLLKGDVPIPFGALVNKEVCIHAEENDFIS
jgi:Arylsulfatase A and related enzymes